MKLEGCRDETPHRYASSRVEKRTRSEMETYDEEVDRVDTEIRELILSFTSRDV